VPKVVIELQANTQDAVNKIQQFARAQKDAFDAIKAGNPALQDAFVKVGKFTDSTKNAAQVTGEFNRASRALASGGIRELAGGIPVVTETLVGLSHTLRGFPAILLGVVGAGAAFLAYLKSVEAQADKTAKSIAGIGDAIQSQTQAMAARVAGIRAGAAGNLGGAAAADFRATQIEAEAARQRALEAAGETRAGAITMADRALGLVNPQALLDKQKLVDAAYQAARAKADADANQTITLAREKLKADLIKIEEDLDKQLADLQEARAEKQKKLLEDLTASALTTFKGLGADFADVTKSLELATFIEKTKQQIADLNAGIEQGIDTHGRFADGVAKLQASMDEAIRLGYVPMTEAVKETTAAVETLGDVGESSTERWLKSLEGISPALDEIAAKARAAAGSVAGTTSASGAVAAGAVAGAAAASGGATGVHGLDFSVLGGVVGQPTGSGLTPLTGGVSKFSGLENLPPGTTGVGGGIFAPSSTPAPAPIISPWVDAPQMQHGGRVPGIGPVPIIAHGGETVIPAGAGTGGRAVVRIEPGAIQIRGTIVDQSRDWDVLVEHLAQTISARLR